MENLALYGEIEQFEPSTESLTIKIGEGFKNNTTNVDNLLHAIKAITVFTKVKELTVKENNFKLILEK